MLESPDKGIQGMCILLSVPVVLDSSHNINDNRLLSSSDDMIRQRCRALVVPMAGLGTRLLNRLLMEFQVAH